MDNKETLYLNVGYKQTIIADNPNHSTIKVSHIKGTNLYVETRRVNKPTLKEAQEQGFANKVYKVLTNKVVVGYLNNGVFKKSPYHD